MSAGSTTPTVATLLRSGALERFARSGLAAALVLVLHEHLLYPEHEARASYHAFLALAHLAALAGGWIAERSLGRGRTLIFAALASALGLVVLAAPGGRASFAAGLALVAIGAAGAVPRLLALEAAAPPRGRARGRTGAIVAALAAALAVPALLAAFGPGAALAPGCLAAALALLLLRSGRTGGGSAPVGRRPHGFVRVVARAISRLGTGHPGQRWLELARDVHPPEAIEGARSVLRVAALLAPLAVLWAVLDQRASSFVLQARRMDLGVAGIELSPAQLLAVGPLLALALGPLLSRGSPLRRMGAGMLLAALSFVAAALIQTLIDAGRAPHVLWQLPQHALLGAGEVLAALGGLDLACEEAPAAMRSAAISAWFLAALLGNVLAALAATLLPLEGASWYWAFAALVVAAALALRAIARRRRAPEAGSLVAG